MASLRSCLVHCNRIYSGLYLGVETRFNFKTVAGNVRSDEHGDITFIRGEIFSNIGFSSWIAPHRTCTVYAICTPDQSQTARSGISS